MNVNSYQAENWVISFAFSPIFGEPPASSCPYEPYRKMSLLVPCIHSAIQSFSTDFFLNNRTRAIYRPTHQLSTINQHPFTHRVSFVYLRQCTAYNLSCKVNFLYTSWMAEMNRGLPYNFFESRSICNKNTSVGAKDLWNVALNRSKRFRWYSRFREGREVVENDERGGRQTSTRTEVNIAAIAYLVKNDRRIASRMIAESLNIPKTVVLRILKEELRKINLCVRFVSHPLTPEQREDRVTSCQDIIAIADADKKIF